MGNSGRRMVQLSIGLSFRWSYSSATNLVLMLCKIRRSRRLSTLQSLDPSALATYCTTEWPTGKCLIFVLMHIYGMYMYISFFWYMYICTSWEHMISSIVFCNDISVCLFVSYFWVMLHYDISYIKILFHYLLMSLQGKDHL